MAGAIFSVFPKIVNLGGRKTQQAIAEKASRGIDKVGEYLSDKYEKMFDGITKGVASVDDLVQSVDDAIAQYPSGTNVGKLNTIRESLLAKKNITAKELHNLKQEVRKIIPKGVWRGTQDIDAIQNAHRDVYFKINDKLAELGGKEYKALSQEYRQYKNFEMLANKMFKANGQPSNSKIFNKMDVPTERALEGLNRQLTPDEQFLQELNAIRRGDSFKKYGAMGLIGLGGIDYLKRVISNASK